MTDIPQCSVPLLPDNEVRFLSLSRTAKVKPKYRPHERRAIPLPGDSNFCGRPL